MILAIVMVTGSSFASAGVGYGHNVPDAGNSAYLMSMALGGLSFVRKFIR
jgi:hypothetical protein